MNTLESQISMMKYEWLFHLNQSICHAAEEIEYAPFCTYIHFSLSGVGTEFFKRGSYFLWCIRCSWDEVHSMKIYNASSVDFVRILKWRIATCRSPPSSHTLAPTPKSGTFYVIVQVIFPKLYNILSCNIICRFIIKQYV